MPSLKQLEEFKTSFLDIGSEAATLARQNIPIDDLPLPTSEPVIPREIPKAAVPEAGEGKDSGAMEMDSGQFPSVEGEDLDFGAFLDTIPDDLSVPPPDIPDIPPPEEEDYNAPDRLPDDREIPEADSADSSPAPDMMADFSETPDFGEDLFTEDFPADEAVPPGDVS
ncbi:MAG: hypothetical protein LBG25_04955, partial [Spirochaetaceae bacterium]|nr:hypothetical protein [Spirochaetaceae bacterium]